MMRPFLFARFVRVRLFPYNRPLYAGLHADAMPQAAENDDGENHSININHRH
jgi:hypothetical protein